MLATLQARALACRKFRVIRARREGLTNDSFIGTAGQGRTVPTTEEV